MKKLIYETFLSQAVWKQGPILHKSNKSHCDCASYLPPFYINIKYFERKARIDWITPTKQKMEMSGTCCVCLLMKNILHNNNNMSGHKKRLVVYFEQQIYKFINNLLRIWCFFCLVLAYFIVISLWYMTKYERIINTEPQSKYIGVQIYFGIIIIFILHYCLSNLLLFVRTKHIL